MNGRVILEAAGRFRTGTGGIRPRADMPPSSLDGDTSTEGGHPPKPTKDAAGPPRSAAEQVAFIETMIIRGAPDVE